MLTDMDIKRLLRELPTPLLDATVLDPPAGPALADAILRWASDPVGRADAGARAAATTRTAEDAAAAFDAVLQGLVSTRRSNTPHAFAQKENQV